ncbi:MAG: DUF1257 domain-containing protein [Candidatus Scalindua sp.]|jgi:hypothetical protein|nr:DUF1257 domain-containing protein [Candidatus Scalindua sp.]
MSEYHQIDIGLKDQECIIKTLEELGYKPQIHAEAVPLTGFQGDKRKQKAHIVIPRKQVGGASNDVGFELINGEYVLRVSEFDKGKKKLRPNQLKQLYAKHKVEKTISSKARKYKLKSKTVDADGRIRIKVAIR